ncbi:uncharacterized protein LOC112177875 [Rosa chinensis]|uniref:uncharacterized protein LOC112177875 n=1 Tax=Rosa chinensis TaxID=74649 RepID=UPI000D0973EC|nr:uncharacterized protein LOC112177875 [Rosa chinensis]
MDKDLPSIKKWIVLYPFYISSKKTMVEGRRIARENPTCAKIGSWVPPLESSSFPTDLTATGGDSALKATDWILNCNSSTATSQPKLDRFFLSQSTNSQSLDKQEPEEQQSTPTPQAPQTSHPGNPAAYYLR